jgi:hypothetical protein
MTVMTLWAILRSPLMFGGNLPDNDEWTLSLLTNDEVLAVNQASVNNRELFIRGEARAYAADVPGPKTRYVAMLNTGDDGPLEIRVPLASLDSRDVRAGDLWQKKDLAPVRTKSLLTSVPMLALCFGLRRTAPPAACEKMMRLVDLFVAPSPPFKAGRMWSG